MKKNTNRPKQLQELSELKSEAEKPNSGLVPQVKCNSKIIENESINSNLEIPLNPEISNNREQSNIITNIGSTEGFAEGKSRKIDSSFVTDNRKARRKAQKQKEAEISRKSYAEVVRNTTGKDLDFYRTYENLVKDENSNSCLIKTSPPVMCTNSADVTNHS